MPPKFPWGKILRPQTALFPAVRKRVPVITNWVLLHSMVTTVSSVVNQLPVRLLVLPVGPSVVWS